MKVGYAEGGMSLIISPWNLHFQISYLDSPLSNKLFGWKDMENSGMAIWAYDRKKLLCRWSVNFSQRILDIWLKTGGVDVGVCVTGSSIKAIFCKYMATKSWWGPHLCLLLWSSLSCHGFLCCVQSQDWRKLLIKVSDFPRIMPFFSSSSQRIGGSHLWFNQIIM